MGTAGGREGMKATGGAEGTEATGIGTGAANGWGGGVVAAMMGLGCGARTDLETSSNHRSASDGVRLWDDMAGEDVGGTTITGVGADQSAPGCAEAGAPAGFLAQGLVSRAGRAGGRTGGLAAGAAAATEKAGLVPFTGATGDCGDEAGLGIGAEEKGSSGGPLNAEVI